MDRDPVFTRDVRDMRAQSGVQPVRLPRRSPNLNAHVERFIRSIKEECLSRLIPADCSATTTGKPYESARRPSNGTIRGPAPDPLSPKHIVIQVTEAEHIPETFRILTEGFQTAMNRAINPNARAVRSERSQPDIIIYRSNGPRP